MKSGSPRLATIILSVRLLAEVDDWVVVRRVEKRQAVGRRDAVVQRRVASVVDFTVAAVAFAAGRIDNVLRFLG